MKDLEQVEAVLCEVISGINARHGTRYKVGNFIAFGGFTYVFWLIGMNNEYEYVVKYTPKNPDDGIWAQISRRKKNEIAMLSGGVNDAYVPKIVDHYTDYDEKGNVDGYIIIERRLQSVSSWLNGQGLEEHLTDNCMLTVMLKDIVESLSYVHTELKMVHEDIKPDNVMFDPVHTRLKLIDFNTSRTACISTDDDTTCPGISPLTIAPEYVYARRENYPYVPEDHYTKVMDIYSAGATVFFWATGTHTVTVSEGKYYEREMSEKAELLRNCGISPILQSIILKAVEIDPDRRYQNVGDMLAEVSELYHIQNEIASQAKELSDLKILNDQISQSEATTSKQQAALKNRLNALESENKQQESKLSETEEALSESRKQLKENNRSIKSLQDQNRILQQSVKKRDTTIAELTRGRPADYSFSAFITGLLTIPTIIGIYLSLCFYFTGMPGSEAVCNMISTYELQLTTWAFSCISALFWINLCLHMLHFSDSGLLSIGCSVILLCCMLLPATPFGIEEISFYNTTTALEGKSNTIKPVIKPLICSEAFLRYTVNGRESHWSSHGVTIKNDKSAFSVNHITVTNLLDKEASTYCVYDNTTNEDGFSDYMTDNTLDFYFEVDPEESNFTRWSIPVKVTNSSGKQLKILKYVKITANTYNNKNIRILNWKGKYKSSNGIFVLEHLCDNFSEMKNVKNINVRLIFKCNNNGLKRIRCWSTLNTI